MARAMRTCQVVAYTHPDRPGHESIRVYLPDSEYEERRCRSMISEWRILAATGH
jgi:hypothetical protein